MTKSTAAELIQRVNVAVQMLSDKTSTAEVLEALCTRYGVSRRQALRYLCQARETPVPLPVPASKIVFTVKLPRDLAEQIRHRAQQRQQAISAVVEAALRAYLARGKHHG